MNDEQITNVINIFNNVNDKQENAREKYVVGVDVAKKTTDKVEFTSVLNTWDNCAEHGYSVDWEEFVRLLDEHTQTPTKMDAMLIIPATFKQPGEDYEPARFPRNHNKAGSIIFRDDGEPQVRRCKANVKYVYFLPLDIDGGMTIDEAKKRFKDYRYCAYTSSGHRTDSKEGKDAFRIFLPFKKRITAAQYESRQKSFREWLGDKLDQSSVDVARGFYIPSYTHDNKHNGHMTWSNEGKLLDADDFDESEVVVCGSTPMVCGLSGARFNGKIIWESLDVVALFKAIGLYKRSAGGTQHDVTCPWHHEHSSSPETGTAVWERTSDSKAGFNCYHGSCKDRTIFEVTQLVKQQNDMEYLKQFYDVVPRERERLSELVKVRSEIDIIKKTLKEKQNEE